MIYEVQFLIALFLTVLIETITLFIVIRYLFKINNKKIGNIILIFLGIFCSTCTLPYLWFVLPAFIQNFYVLALIGEPAVFIIEAIIYYFVLNLGIKKSLIVSLLCNLMSFLIGLLILPWLINIIGA